MNSIRFVGLSTSSCPRDIERNGRWLSHFLCVFSKRRQIRVEQTKFPPSSLSLRAVKGRVYPHTLVESIHTRLSSLSTHACRVYPHTLIDLTAPGLIHFVGRRLAKRDRTRMGEGKLEDEIGIVGSTRD